MSFRVAPLFLLLREFFLRAAGWAHAGIVTPVEAGSTILAPAVRRSHRSACSGLGTVGDLRGARSIPPFR
jgi:hypothetical protein